MRSSSGATAFVDAKLPFDAAIATQVTRCSMGTSGSRHRLLAERFRYFLVHLHFGGGSLLGPFQTFAVTNPFIRNIQNNNLVPHHSACTSSNTNQPVVPAQVSGAKGKIAKFDKDGLRKAGNNDDGPKDRVLGDAFEYIALAVKLAHVDFIEQRHHDKHVEDHCVVDSWLVRVCAPAIDVGESAIRMGYVVIVGFAVGAQRVTALNSELFGKSKNEVEHDAKLIDSMKQNIADHDLGPNGLGAAIRMTIQQLLSGLFSGKRQRRQRVHEQVDPQQLDGFQR